MQTLVYRHIVPMSDKLLFQLLHMVTQHCLNDIYMMSCLSTDDNYLHDENIRNNTSLYT